MFTRRGIRAASQLVPRNSSSGKIYYRIASRNFSVTHQCPAKTRSDQPPDDNVPIKFSTSKAASWSMSNTIIAPKRDSPWYQPISIITSISVFLIYFLVLREENDFDLELNYSLFERLPHLEEPQLKVAIDYFRREGKDTKDLEKRLAELQLNKQTSS